MVFDLLSGECLASSDASCCCHCVRADVTERCSVTGEIFHCHRRVVLGVRYDHTCLLLDATIRIVWDHIHVFTGLGYVF